MPLFKKGCTKKPEVYRPASITAVIGKLLKTTLKDKIYIHLEKQGLIRNSMDFCVGDRVKNFIEFFEEIIKKFELEKGLL